MVAYAKIGPLLRLRDDFEAWRHTKRPIRAIIGIDQKGTSREALEFALGNFDEVRIAHVDNGIITPTFHPKVYLFVGPKRSLAYVGSNNLTVGGTETNFEACTILTLDPVTDAPTVQQLQGWFTSTHAVTVNLTTQLLATLVDRGLVLTEREQQASRRAATKTAGGKVREPDPPLFPSISIKPPSPLPKGVSTMQTSLAATQDASSPTKRQPNPSEAAVGFAIQVTPHRNGEVFLSKTAIGQNPGFFGWPFTGVTMPKKRQNAGYPQRVPDPVVNVRAYDATGNSVLSVPGYALNTVYYAGKSELRITFRPDILAKMPDRSILVFREAAATDSHDYDIDVFAPGSSQYQDYLLVCNQTMPSGGKTNPRRFGWF